MLAMRTATHPSTSSIRCHKTTFSLRDDPFFNRNTASPFTSIPSIANINIPFGLISSGLKMRGIDLTKIKTEPPTKTKLLIRAERRENLACPKE